MSIKILAWNQAVIELGAIWKDLVISQELNVSLHPSWMSISVTSHGLSPKAFVVFIDMPAGGVAIVPLLFRKVWMSGVVFRCLDLASNLVSYHAEVLASESMLFVVNSLLKCKQLPAWDLFRMDNLVVGGYTSLALSGLSEANEIEVIRHEGERSPYLPVSGNWSDFKKSLSAKLRSNINRYSRNISEMETVRNEWFENSSDTDKLMEDILDVERRSWKSSEGIAIQSSSVEGSYYRGLLPWLGENGLQANVLYKENIPLAYSLCASWRGWVGQIKTSFAHDCDMRGIGFYVNQISIERAFSSGAREYDFLGRSDPHKTQWTGLARPHDSYWIMAPHFGCRMKMVIKSLAGGMVAVLRRNDVARKLLISRSF